MGGRKHADIPWRMGLRSLVSRAVDSVRSLASQTRPNKPYKLPDDPIFTRLLQSHHHQGQRSDIIIHDVHGFEKSYGDLLSDILRTAERLRKGLPPTAFCERGLLGQDLPYVGVLVHSGYEFIVAFFAIRSLGGACMPLSASVLPEEAHYFISKSKAVHLLAGNGCHDTAAAACAFTKSNGGPNISWHPISNNAQPKNHGRSINLEIDPALPLDPRSPGLLIFTSGTTGLPKGVILPRSLFSVTLIPGTATRPVSVVYRSPHWIAGASGLINSVLAGSTLHVLDYEASAADILDAAVRHRPTRMNFTPTLLRQMREVILSRGHGEGEALEQYAVAFRHLGGLTTTSAPLEPSLRDWWAGVTGSAGKNMYAATEAGGVITAGGKDGSIGEPVPGTEIKLSGSPSGEILIKSPFMSIGYLGDEESTKAAFTEDGFWKTGDTAEVKGGKFFFTGRASADYIYFRFYRIPSLIVETGILGLPYVTDACVLGVPYRDTKQLCGAVVKIRADGAEAEVDLARIRADLSGVVAKYMLPVVLRILGEDEQIPRTYSGKPIKKKILSEFLGTADWFPAEEVPEGVEYCGCVDPAAADNGTRKAWDFGGVR